MNTKNSVSLVLFLAAAAVACACGAPKPEVEIASSAGEAGYAAAYPERLAAADKGLDAIAADARAGMGELAGYPGQLSASDWTVVRGAYERADAAGRGRSYAAGAESDRAVRAFFDEERDDIGRRISGSVTTAVSKEASGVTVDVSGTVAFALKDGVTKRLDKRFAASNEARLFLEQRGAAIGKKDAEALEGQVDRLSRISYLVNVGYAEQRVLVARMRAEAKDVAETLDAEIEAEGPRCNDPALAKDDKKACEQRIAELMAARAALDPAVAACQRTDEGMLAAQDALKKEYAQALGALLDAIDQKIKETPPSAQ
jgi:hypothetical protein